MKGERKKGAWTFEEDIQLISYITFNGEGRWEFLAKASGLNRSGRSCRLRWVNYLSPDLNHTNMTPQEERLIVDLHARWGNSWSRIAQSLPGRTDNGIKNYWKTHLKKKILHKGNAGDKVHLESSIHSSSLPSPSTTGAQRQSAISSFQPNPITFMTNEFQSEAQNAAAPNGVQFTLALAQEEYSTDLAYNLSGDLFSSELGFSLNNTPSRESFSNRDFYLDELWNMDQ
ncbi:MYB-like transcription factor EOBII [Cryptomeria japonica]|uniref:MYB-like transcription factor EOBII n=1 Tax=Cryptomeria japonica TaxID=3369 RepID=UPI0027DA1FB6|nr:MYB-like transcription factor EOBII [Cryptomeria japonica]